MHQIIVDEKQYNEICTGELTCLTMKGDQKVFPGDKIIVHQFYNLGLFKLPRITDKKVFVEVDSVRFTRNKKGKVKSKCIFFTLMKGV